LMLVLLLLLLLLVGEVQEVAVVVEEEQDVVLLTTTSPGFLEITDIITTGVLVLVAEVEADLEISFFPFAFKGVVVVEPATTSFSLEIVLSRTSMIFVFLPFHAFGGGGVAAEVGFVLVDDSLDDAALVVLELESTTCFGVGSAAKGEIGLEPSMLSLRPFQAIVMW